MIPGKRRTLNLETNSGQLYYAAERVKGGFRAKVGHTFLAIKRLFGLTKVRYHGRRLI